MNATLGAHVCEWAPSTLINVQSSLKKENIESLLLPAFTQPSQSFFTCFHGDVVVLLVARRAVGALWIASKGHLVSRTQTDVNLQLNIAPPFVMCSLLVSRDSRCKDKNSETFSHILL